MIKKNFIFAGFLILILSLSVVSFPLLADAQNSNDKGKPQVISAIGKIPGKDQYVDVWVEVPQGADPKDVAAKALARLGALPISESQYSLTGFVWNQFNILDDGDDFVVQTYVKTGERVDGYTVLERAQDTWNGVESSSFLFTLEEEYVEGVCPSRISYCGFPHNDGINHVAWVHIADSGILGVAAWDTKDQEVDMIWNSNRGDWNDNGGSAGIDAETVMLHELGHGLGLSHSNVQGSIMQAFYGGVQRTLHADDIAGVSALYPAPSIEVTSPTTENVKGKFTISADVVGVSDPIVYFEITGPNGYENITNPDLNAPYQISLHAKDLDPGQYTIVAYETSQSLSSDPKTFTIENKKTDDSEGGSGGPPCSKNNKPGCVNK